jgi:hypothetical protein
VLNRAAFGLRPENSALQHALTERPLCSEPPSEATVDQVCSPLEEEYTPLKRHECDDELIGPHQVVKHRSQTRIKPSARLDVLSPLLSCEVETLHIDGLDAEELESLFL